MLNGKPYIKQYMENNLESQKQQKLENRAFEVFLARITSDDLQQLSSGDIRECFEMAKLFNDIAEKIRSEK